MCTYYLVPAADGAEQLADESAFSDARPWGDLGWSGVGSESESEVFWDLERRSTGGSVVGARESEGGSSLRSGGPGSRV